MTRRRKLLMLIAAVPVLLVTIALLYLNFADLSGWRDTVARLASGAIGRELRIDGEFRPEIGFATRVFATDITLANADWSDDPQMVSVDRLAGEIDLLSIFFGPITIGNVEDDFEYESFDGIPELSDQVIDDIQDYAMENPERVAEVIQSWIHGIDLNKKTQSAAGG